MFSSVLPSRRLVWKLLRHRVIERPLWQWWLRHLFHPETDAEFMGRFSFSNGVGDVGLFTNHMHVRVGRHFFFDVGDQADYLPHLAKAAEQTVRHADSVVAHAFAVLGSQPISLGQVIDWHVDFKTGRRWPLVPPKKIDQLGLGEPSDIKVPWELARFHFASWLGQAYWVTGDEIYAREFATLVDEWLTSNPFGFGIHWSNAMEVSIRACNWILAIGYFRLSPSLPPTFWLRLYRALWQHACFIRYNLEIERVVGNHLVANGTGLLFLGVLFGCTANGRSWLRSGRKILEEEMTHQIHEDGVDYEKSTSYHRLVLELFYCSAIVARKSGAPLSPRFMQRLERMFEFTLHYTRPDGTAPLFGDSDDGRLFRFSAQDGFQDHRTSLAIGAALFKRADMWSAASGQDLDVLWLLGPKTLRDCEELRSPSEYLASKAFPQAGYFILRSKDSWLMADAGLIGPHNWGGHGHRDTLSFELAYRDESFLVDPGTPCYTSDVNLHRKFSGADSHNTITVDRFDIADWVDIWKISHDPTSPKVLRFDSDLTCDILVAQHYGFTRLPDPILHRRTWRLLKNIPRWLVEDELEGQGEHEFALFFHLAPKIVAEEVNADACRWTLHGSNHSLQLLCDIALEREPGEVAPRYGVRAAATVLVGRVRCATPLRIVTELSYVQRNHSDAC